MKAQKVIRMIFAILIFGAGIAALFYPVFSDIWNQHRQNSMMDDYQDTVQQMTEEDYSAYLKAAQDYNATCSQQIYDSFSGEELPADDLYWSLLNISGDGIMGYIEIPQIRVRLPIYHGTSEKVLQQGLGHLLGTSLPVGGKGTHCVLSGHRGLPSALLLTNLDKVKLGDVFYLHVLHDTLAYEVDQIQTVDPSDVEALQTPEDGDYVTLITCTPYGVNTQRLLVRGRRTTVPEEAQEVTPVQQVLTSFGWKIYVLLAVILLFLLWLILLWRKRRKKRKAKQERECIEKNSDNWKVIEEVSARSVDSHSSDLSGDSHRDDTYRTDGKSDH